MNVKVMISILGLLVFLVGLNGCTEFFMDVDGSEDGVIPVRLFYFSNCNE